MRIKLLLYGSLLAGVLAISGPAFAHHAWHGYDMANLTTLRGAVTQFDWANPHVWIYLDVKDDKGNAEKWNAGGPSPSRMANTGWDKDTLKPGDQITVIGVIRWPRSDLLRWTLESLVTSHFPPWHSASSVLDLSPVAWGSLLGRDFHPKV